MPQDPHKKKKMWGYLALWFIMPFTAFMALEKLFTDDEDPKDLDDDPQLGTLPKDKFQESEPSPDKHSPDKS